VNYVGNSYYLPSDKGYEKILWKLRGYECVERLRTTVLDWLLRLHASQATEVRTFALWWHSKETHISHFIVETAAPNCPIPPNHGLSLLISVECV